VIQAGGALEIQEPPGWPRCKVLMNLGAPYAGYACGDFDFAFLSMQHRNPFSAKKDPPSNAEDGGTLRITVPSLVL
jgi:hypothetical protein